MTHYIVIQLLCPSRVLTAQNAHAASTPNWAAWMRRHSGPARASVELDGVSAERVMDNGILIYYGCETMWRREAEVDGCRGGGFGRAEIAPDKITV